MQVALYLEFIKKLNMLVCYVLSYWDSYGSYITGYVMTSYWEYKNMSADWTLRSNLAISEFEVFR